MTAVTSVMAFFVIDTVQYPSWPVLKYYILLSSYISIVNLTYSYINRTDRPIAWFERILISWSTIRHVHRGKHRIPERRA